MKMVNRSYWFLGVAAVFFLLVFALQPILMPFLVAALFAYLTDPVVDKLETKKLSRTTGVVIVFVGLTLMMIILALLILPLFGKQLFSFMERLPEYIAWIQSNLFPYIQSTFGIQIESMPADKIKNLFTENWQQTSDLLSYMLKSLTASSLTFFALVANILLIPVVTFYLLRDWDYLVEWIRNSIPRPWEKQVVSLTMACDEVLSAFIRGQLLVMMALGTIYSIGLSIVGLDLALFLGTLAGLASVVPYLGAVVGIGSASIAAYMQFHEFMPVVYVLVIFGVGQALEGMVLTPLLVGDKIGLHPVAVIFAIMAGGQLAGFTGILLALPIAAVLMVLLRYLHDEYKDSDLYDTVVSQGLGSKNIAVQVVDEKSVEATAEEVVKESELLKGDSEKSDRSDNG